MPEMPLLWGPPQMPKMDVRRGRGSASPGDGSCTGQSSWPQSRREVGVEQAGAVTQPLHSSRTQPVPSLSSLVPSTAPAAPGEPGPWRGRRRGRGLRVIRASG